MHPFRCLAITLISGTLFMSLTTGCAEKRQSTRHLTESWPSPATQAQPAGETTSQGQDAVPRTDDTGQQQKPSS